MQFELFHRVLYAAFSFVIIYQEVFEKEIKVSQGVLMGKTKIENVVGHKVHIRLKMLPAKHNFDKLSVASHHLMLWLTIIP